MIEISIKQDIKKTLAALDSYRKDIIPAATASALNRTATTVKSVATKEIAQRTGLKQSYVREKLAVIKASRQGLVAIVRALPKGVNLIQFVSPTKRNTKAFRKMDKKGNPKFKGAQAKAWGKTTTYKGSFIGTGKGSGKQLVFVRTGPQRDAPLKALHGPSVPMTFANKVVTQVMRDVIAREFGKNFAHEIKWRSDKK